MRNYYLDETLGNMEEQTGCSRAENLEMVRNYFTNNFTPEELLELLIRGQIHALEDERTDGYYSR